MFEVKSRVGGERLSVGCLPVLLARELDLREFAFG